MIKINDKRFDLEERTAKFGINTIKLCKLLKHDTISRPITNQLVRSATSIGANYMEANGANSKKEKELARKLWQECHEFTLIFGKITATLKNKN